MTSKGMYRGLVIDDDPASRLEIIAYLDLLGHDHEQAECVMAAREKLTQGGFHYVVLDLQLPFRPRSAKREVDFGFELLREISSKYPAVGVVVVSGEGKGTRHIVDVMRYRERGALVSFVAKPFDSKDNTNFKEELKNLVEEVSARRQRVSIEPAPPSVQAAQVSADSGPIVIDLDCVGAGRQRYTICVNGKPQSLRAGLLRLLVCFGKAQARVGESATGSDAPVSADDFRIGNPDEDHNLSAEMSKLRGQFKSWGVEVRISNCGHRHWKINARVINAPQAEAKLRG